MGSLVFVSSELYPYTAGGIGRVVYNMLRTMSDEDRSRSIVVLLDADVDPVTFAAVFPDVQLMQVNTTEAGDFPCGAVSLPSWAYSDTDWHWRSAVAFRALARLARSTSIEYIEFPDWGGLSFCTLQERRLTGFLQDATIAVRLHSAHGVMINAQPHPISQKDLNLSDLERKCLRDCDVIVAQLASVAAATRTIFGFMPAEWDDRVIEHAPPVLLDHVSSAASSVPFCSDQSILFTSKLQPVKRPDLFVRGVSQFLREKPEFVGSAILATHAPRTGEYPESIIKLIPPELESRFRSVTGLQSQTREALIANGTVVVPSPWESFCLAAYEASLLGARIILNGSNPAFMDGTPWIDGVNCFKFDGSATSLADALHRNSEHEGHLLAVTPPENPWPWRQIERQNKRFKSVAEEPLVSVVIPHFNLGTYLPETLANVSKQTYDNLEVILVDDASTDPHSRLVINAIAGKADARLKILKLPGNVGLSGARNTGIAAAKGSYILTLDADDLVDPDFVATGVAALENNPDFSVVVTPAAYFVDEDVDPSSGLPIRFRDYAVFSGEAVTAGIVENRFSTATALFRRSVFDEVSYNEDLNCFEDWSLYLRMCDLGMRFIVTTDPFFFYRRRQNSMVNAPRNPLMTRAQYSDLMRTSAPLHIRAKGQHLALGMAATLTQSLPVATKPKKSTLVADSHRSRAKHKLSTFEQEVMFGSLKAARFLHARAPYVLKLGLFAARRCWRLYKAVRGAVANRSRIA